MKLFELILNFQLFAISGSLFVAVSGLGISSDESMLFVGIAT